LVPLGILVLATGVLSLMFGNHETSDFWIDCLTNWWTRVRSSHRGIRRLVIFLDNGPKNSGRRKQFLKRLVEFADWSGLEIRLVYYPPYHSKYNPIERCWSSLQKKWNGVLLKSWTSGRRKNLRQLSHGRHSELEGNESDQRSPGTLQATTHLRYYH
jgi:transposase